jgi:hypothetical protein
MFRRPDAAPNATVQAVPVFTVDPHGESMFAGILAGTLGSIAGPRAVIDANRSNWHGWTKAPQRFRGAVNVVGGGRAVTSPVTSLHQERGTSAAPDVVQQIFESRGSLGRFE